MVISQTIYGSIIFAKVLRVKPGSGSAAGKLTIVTLQDIVTLKEYKMLCWNSQYENGSMLSDRARKLVFGELITARVRFDIGDERKCICYEMKKRGIYKTVSEDGIQYVICGKVAKATVGNNIYCLMIPSDSYTNAGKTTHWYQVNFWNNSSIEAKEKIKKGDIVCIRCYNLKERIHNGFAYKELTGTYFKTGA